MKNLRFHGVNPVHLTAVEWCDFMTPELSQFGPIPRLMDESQWQSWAANVVLLPRLSACNPPSPTIFDDWRKWAEQFAVAIQEANHG